MKETKVTKEAKERKRLEAENVKTIGGLFTLVNANTPQGQDVSMMTLSRVKVGHREKTSLEMKFDSDKLIRENDKDGDRVELTEELHSLMTPFVSKIMRAALGMYDVFRSCAVTVKEDGSLEIQYNVPGLASAVAPPSVVLPPGPTIVVPAMPPPVEEE